MLASAGIQFDTMPQHCDVLRVNIALLEAGPFHKATLHHSTM